MLVVGVVAIVALVGYLVLRPERGADRAVDEPPAIAVPPVRPPVAVEQPTVVDEAEALAPLVVTLDFVDDSWLEAEVDGERQLSEQVAKGESRRLLAAERVVLSLGNAEGVRIEVNGTPYELQPSSEETAPRQVEITLETADQLAHQGAP